ncbi:hypothetical protein [Vreelandella profundi]|uniref:hypothetical protein n=1 Tax=Vreelandella profundi TaxID=2852117 RepID=UPI001F17A578|nr:hypothetical protein [Halomonas profundi]
MKQALRACAAVCALTLSSITTADEFHLYDHKKQCGMEEQRIEPYSQAELDNFLACIVAERDAMGRLMGQWTALDTDLKEQCVAASAEAGRPGIVSYAEVEDCISR